jgi:hypothetical protein
MSEMRHSDHERIRDELIERDPADDEPTRSGPADDEPARSGPADDEPARTGPADDEPAYRDAPGSAEMPRAGMGRGDGTAELFEPDDVDRFRAGWRDVQSRFVDDPREAVEGADRLVADVMQSLTSRFTDRKHELEVRWQQGSEAETEDLRQALRSYRSFFDRLLNV